MDDNAVQHGWPDGTGDMAGRVRDFDWGETPLGPLATWPEGLRAVVDLVLSAPAVASVALLDDRRLIYNDAAARLYGAHHPGALGRPLAATFPDTYPTVAPLYDRVFGGEALIVRDQPLAVGTTGDEEVFDACITPVRGADGSVIGAHMVGFEVGARHRAEALLRESEERQAFLLNLTDALRPLTEQGEIERAATRLLGDHLRADRCFLSPVHDDGSGVCVREEYLRDGASSVLGDYTFAQFGDFVGPELHGGRILAVADVDALAGLGPAERASYAAAGIGAYLLVPLVDNGRLAAFLTINHRTPRTWSEAAKAVARQTADRLWTARERARAGTALRESEERLAAAFESVPVGVAIIDTAGQAVFANADYRRFLPSGIIPSRDPAHLARWCAWDKEGEPIDPKAFPGARALRGEAVVPGLDMLYRNDEGREIWTNVATVPVRDAAGSVIGAVTAISNIDLAKRSSEALRDSEERLRQFGEASQDVLWIRDAETFQWEYLTPAFETIYGLDRTIALGGDNMAGWAELIVPEDRDRAVADIRRVRDGEWVTFEYRIRRPSDGKVRWLRDTDFPIGDAVGRVAHIGGIGHDITEIKEAEAALAEVRSRQRALIEGMPQLVWRAVDGGHWTWASSQWTAYTGQTEAASLGRGWQDVVHPDDRQVAHDAWATAMDAGGFEIEYRLRHAPSGTYRWFQNRATPVRNADGTVIEWLGTSTDIDDLRALQERQRILVDELQHRTFNLMGMVRSMADVTIRSSVDLDEFRLKFRDRIDALARVQRLLSRLKEGDHVYFHELLESELSATGALTNGNSRVSREGPTDVALRSGAVQTLAMAIHELTTNAVKYGALKQPAGHLHVAWRLEDAPDGGASLHIDWAETGVDMSATAAGPRGTGHGRALIEDALPYQLQARTTYVMTADGVKCSIVLPAPDHGANTKVGDNA